MAARIGRSLLARGEHLAVVETSAGGRIAAALFSIVGASGWLRASLVPYDRVSQDVLLGISLSSSVSEEAAIALAIAARTRLQTEWALAETGIAGPQIGRRSTKPAGLTWFAIAGPEGTATRQVLLPDSGRRRNMQGFAAAAVAFLDETLPR